jgi:hypothetical protein
VSLIPANTLPSEMSVVMWNKNIIVRSNIKQPSPGRYSTKSVLHTPSHSNGIQ